ncbi:MAG: methenyltetrahydromethanopterin cyclohydrolase [Phycisphaeraceae bacterium]
MSLNDRALVVAHELGSRAGELGVEPMKIGYGSVIDCGINTPGSLGAGLLLARACLADLGTVTLSPGRVGEVPLPFVNVNVSAPVAACMASQYAGWQISVGKFFAMGSGPMRACYGKEPLFDEPLMSRFKERPGKAVGILETRTLPDKEVIDYLLDRTEAPPGKLALLVAPTASLAGGVQVVARSVETALHKLHTIKFDLARIVGGFGSAPLPPVAKNDLAAIGRTNDAVLYGGAVTLFATGDDESLEAATQRLPSSTSADYGRPFGEIFKRYNHDFYKLDPMLFSPALVCIQNLTTGRSFVAGSINEKVLTESFFG